MVQNSDVASRWLQFWTSTEIAPLVRTCRATWAVRIPGIESTWPQLSSFSHHFTNLAHLILASVYYDQTFLENLRLLPRLTQLEVNSCFLAVDETIHPSNLTALQITDFTYRVTYHSRSSPTHWFPLLTRTTLRSLATDYDRGLFTEILSGQSLPSLKRLEFNINPLLLLLSNLRVLSKFPATEILTIRDRAVPFAHEGGEESDTPLFDILTSLQEYRGPDDFLHALLPIPSLRRLFLPCEDPSRRLAKLRSIETPNNVTSLNVQFRDFDHENLRELCGFFPHLTNLVITVTIPPVIEYDFEEWSFDQNPSWEVHDFFGSLSEDLPFPLGIRKLAIHWELEDNKALIEEGVPDFHALTDALVSKYPSIEAIWLDGPPGCLYYWRDGEVKVQCLEDDSKDTYWERSYSLNNELEVFWDTI
ncbi:hypothetical protein B0H11DRAFT_1908693 [Mycena galericulata]|nr:hypothetical protein B0H11DRAFT_1908693 [Mycena galericulata]